MAGTLSFGSYNELDFLVSLQAKVFGNNDNQDTIWGDLKSAGTSGSNVVVFKGKQNAGTANIKKHLASITSDNSINQYSQLVKYFASSPTFNSLKLAAAHFVYLKELGVHPMNRLWILRRFEEGVVVPDNLTDWKTKEPPQPIATVVGWIKPTETEFMTVGFNESWTTTNQRFYKVLAEMIDKEFQLDVGKVMDVPGFAQGLLVQFLKSMELQSEFDANNLPMGDPNILSEGATRMTDPYDSSMKLNSSISFNLTTEYEQKFIGDVDPGLAMLDVISNLKKLGTSDVKYLFSKDSKVLQDLLTAANAKNSAELWLKAIQSFITMFNKAVSDTFNDVKSSVKSGTIVNDAVKTILSSTVAKYKWPLIGAIAGDTGMNSTPWHLTVGNPYSPFFSMGNVIVKNVELKWNNEFSFNDMPTDLTVSIQVSQGRNLGGQEILSGFNNGYKRVYQKDKIGFK